MPTARLIPLILGTLLLTVAPLAAQSQAINGSIEGVVKDPSGAVLPGVTVAIRSVDTGAARTVVTNNDGFYRAVTVLTQHSAKTPTGTPADSPSR